jgi:hypothetical protein
MKHEFKISIDAKDRDEAVLLLFAMLEIKNCLSDNDLKELAKILKKNPAIVKTAKKFLE